MIQSGIQVGERPAPCESQIMFIIQDDQSKELYNSVSGWSQGDATLYNKIEDVRKLVFLNRYTHSWTYRNIVIIKLSIERIGKLHEFL